jgi:hypothetical protein
VQHKFSNAEFLSYPTVSHWLPLVHENKEIHI